MTLEKIYRITVQIPTSELPALTTALARSNLLLQDNYRDVYFCFQGTEHFTPLAGATPRQGQINTPAEIASTQMVFAIPYSQETLAAVLDQIRHTHPWEKPVIFVDESLMPVE